MNIVLKWTIPESESEEKSDKFKEKSDKFEEKSSDARLLFADGPETGAEMGAGNKMLENLNE